jgi:DtxR family Mn-dependent transcriptional regulator
MTTGRTEDYLEAIHTIMERKGYAQVKDVSKILDLGPSTVTEMFQKLTKAGYLNYEKYGGVTLTPNGKKIAKATKAKHIMLHNFLLILGVDDEIANDDACKIEHVLTPESLDRLTKFVEFIRMKEENPRWLDHFNYFFETGKYIECTPVTKKNCPVHGKKEK